MSNTIQVSAGLVVTDGTTELFAQRNSTQSLTQTGTHAFSNTQNVPTTAAGTALALGADLGTNGWSFFRNLDTTNYIEIGVFVTPTFYPFVKLLAGEKCVLKLGTAAPYARANTATAKLYYAIAEV